MADYTLRNLKEDVDDAATQFGLAPDMEAHFARNPLETENSAISYLRLAPNFRMPFGHKHEEQEEVYVVVGGGGKLKLDDEVVDIREWDAIRIPNDTMRALEAGPDGVELILIGAPLGAKNDAEMVQGWWSD